jgi:hypothetical protein
VLNSLELYGWSNVDFPSNDEDGLPANDADDGAANADNDDEDGDGGGSICLSFATDRGGVDSDSAGHSTPLEETEEDAG